MKIFNIEDFGARRDGSDCSEAIRRAIKAAEAYGKGVGVKIPKGKYVIDKTIQLPGSTKITGDKD